MSKTLPIAFSVLFAATCAADTLSMEDMFIGDGLSLDNMSDLALQDIPMVVTPAKLSQPRVEVSSTISVLDSEFIRRSNAQTVEELLQYVPGFIVGPYDSSSSKVVAYHGTQLDRFRRMQVLINGRSVYSSAYAGVNWAMLPLAVDDVERIEVNRGPNAAVYGANSFLGVINIITRSPLETVGGKAKYFSNDAGGRSLYGQYSVVGDQWSLRASASQTVEEGYDGTDDIVRNDGHQKNTANILINHTGRYSTTDIEFGGSQLAGELDKLSVKIGNKKIPLTYPKSAPLRDVERSFVSLVHSVQTSRDHELKAQFTYEESRWVDKHHLELPQDINLGLFKGELTDLTGDLLIDLDEQRQDLEIQSSWVPSSSFSWVNSALYRIDKAYSKTYFNGEYTENLLRTSSVMSVKPSDQLVVNLGGMWEKSKLSGEYWSPQAGVTWLFSPSNSVRANVSKAYRTPDLFDQEADWSYVFNDVRSRSVYAVNGEQAEEITSYEIGYFHDLPAYGLSFDLMVYREVFDGMVVSGKNYLNSIDSATKQSMSYDSTGVLVEGDTIDFIIEGAELEVDWRSPTGILARLTYATQNTQTDENATLNTVPINTASVLFSYPVTDKWQLSTSYYYVYGMPDWVYKNVNLWASYQFKLGRTSYFDLGFGGSKRLDKEPYIITENISDDKDRLYAFANVTF
ncbi:TonB-dependent receptor [Maribrevibacterium harenarium]|uniref:TonB-dependent receptor n=1 Tax=Maribrevibacterium harenarium TaxID=2589817 RepID=A0A501X221_9GAMM|nr:TonB-dependent receptor [Maribrevibacterium harenarium]TPE54524.1 TonB-dependent receptor [Maribrevibacterium harenarium]